jgi:hypothetical protein
VLVGRPDEHVSSQHGLKHVARANAPGQS